MKISCKIIQDLLPLYYDEVCSKESHELVKDHLSSCEECSNYLNELKTDPFEENINLDIENSKVNSLKKLNKEFFKKKLKIAIISAISVYLLFIISYLLISRLEFPINYKEGLIGTEDIEDNKFKITFLGDDFYRFHFFEESVKINGEENHILLIYYSNTLWTKLSFRQNFYPNSEGSIYSDDSSNTYGFTLGHPENLVVDKNFDYIFYLVDDYEELSDSNINEKDFNDYLKNATLLWEK